MGASSFPPRYAATRRQPPFVGRGFDARPSRLAPRPAPHTCRLGLASRQPTVTVTRRLKVAYFSTGDEILSLGDAPREGAVYDSNRYTVFGMLQRLGCEVIDLGVVPGRSGLVASCFCPSRRASRCRRHQRRGQRSARPIATKAMMRQLAADDADSGVVFWRIAMRPGRPMAVGRIRPPQAHTVESPQPSAAATRCCLG